MKKNNTVFKYKTLTGWLFRLSPAHWGDSRMTVNRGNETLWDGQQLCVLGLVCLQLTLPPKTAGLSHNTVLFLLRDTRETALSASEKPHRSGI